MQTNPDTSSLIHESTLLAEFIYQELLLRGGIILLVAVVLVLLFSHNRPTTRSLLWFMLICGLALMPLLGSLLPDLAIALNADNRVASIISRWPSLNGLTDLQSSTVIASLAGIYLTVMTLGLVYLLTGILQLYGIQRRARALDDATLTALAEQLRSSNGIRCSIALAYSDEIQSPLTWGLWQHKILLPSAARQWPEALLAQCISHELAHIQRMDWVCHLLSRVVVCLYWFNPLVWWLHGKFTEDSEKACDAAVIDDTGCPITYAENLLWLANSFGKTRVSVATSMFSSRSILFKRVSHILADNAFHPADGRSGLIAGLVFSVLLIAPLSAMKFNFIAAVEPAPKNNLIHVNFYPRESLDHARLLGEFDGVVASLQTGSNPH